MAVSSQEMINTYWKNSYPQYWSRIIEKNNLKQGYIDIFNNLPKYRFLGTIGNEIYKDITTGPCLLTSMEINSLNKNTTINEVREMLMRHPTFEDYVSIAPPTKKGYNIHIILETYEYAKLINYKTNISYEDSLKLTIEAANNFKKYYNYKLKNTSESKNIYYYLTHTEKVDSKLRELCNEYYNYYLSNSNLSKKGKEIIKENPEQSNWLRVKVSFLPYAIGKDKTTIVEPSSSIEGMKPANILCGSSAIITRSPSSLLNRPVMNNGKEYNEIFYLNNNLEEELDKLKIYNNKEFYKTPAYGLSNIYLKEYLDNNYIDNINGFENLIYNIFGNIR